MVGFARLIGGDKKQSAFQDESAVMKKKRRTPCGIASFAMLRDGNCAYVDKTPVIERLEALSSNSILVVRPRRFGKSLLTTTLEAYYDRHEAKCFDKFFAGTYIHEHKTPLAGQCYVASFDFSGMGSSSNIVNSIMSMVKGCVTSFFTRYPWDGWEKIVEAPYSTPGDLIQAFMRFVAPWVEGKLYFIIDEYDQFANELLATDRTKYKAVTSSQSVLRDFYDKIKATEKSCPVRLFVTGVLPISLDSTASGLSMAADCTTVPVLSDALGFTESELRRLIDDTVDFDVYGQSGDQIFGRMKELYDGYRFSPSSDKTVFNAMACLNYLRAIRDENIEPEGDDLVDTAFEGDARKIQTILALGNRDEAERLVERVLQGRPLRLPTPGLAGAVHLDKNDRLDEKALLSTFFYMGFLTWAPGSRQELVCPNKMVREQFFQYYFEYCSAFGAVNADEEAMAKISRQVAAGDLTPFLHYMAASLAGQTGRHAQLHASESSLQFYLLALARSLRGYVVTAEEEALGRGVTDLLFKPVKPSEKTPSYLLELKRLPKSKATPAAVEAAVAEAEAQLANYAKAANIAALLNLQRISVIFVGLSIERITALS